MWWVCVGQVAVVVMALLLLTFAAFDCYCQIDRFDWLSALLC